MKNLARAKLALGIVGSLLAVAFLTIWFLLLKRTYESNEFISQFSLNLLSTITGVIVGALVAVLVTLFVINPVIRYQEEKKFAPLRRPILEFWERYLTLSALGVLMELDCSKKVSHLIVDVFDELANKAGSRVEKRKLDEIRDWLGKQDATEIEIKRAEVFEKSLQDFRERIDRMHTTLVALPYLFTRIPEIAVGVEVLLGNVFSGLTVLKEEGYKYENRGKQVIAKLDFYCAFIVKNMAYHSLLLSNEIQTFLAKQEVSHGQQGQKEH